MIIAATPRSPAAEMAKSDVEIVRESTRAGRVAAAAGGAAGVSD